jgi:PAS domain S-box-containing protein
MADFSAYSKRQTNVLTAEKIFRDALKNTPISIAALDRDLRFTWVYDPKGKVPAEEFVGTRIGELSKLKDASSLISFYNEVLKSGLPKRIEIKLEYSDRTGIHEVYATPLKNDKGEVTGLLVASTDISERKKAEKAIEESEKRFNRSQEIAHLGSWELDLTTDQLSWSDEVYRIFGMKPQEFGATYEAFLDAVHPDDRAAVDAAYTGSLREGRDTYEIEHRVVRKSTGEIRIVHEKCDHIRDESGRIVRSIGMVHDITERKKAEEEIERLASFPALNPNPVVEADFDGKIEYVNAATKTMFPDIETLGLRHPFFSDWETVVTNFKDEKINTFGREVKIDEHWYHQQFSLVPKSLCIRIYAENFDEIKKAEETLQKQAALIDLSPDAIIGRKLDGTITFWSKGAEKLYGWTKEEALGKQTHSIVRTKFAESFGDIKLKLAQFGYWSGELTQYTKAGREVVVQSWWMRRPDEHGNISEILESNVDVTERKRIQTKLEEYANKMEELANERAKQLSRAERLVTIGQTAGMVGHDIRNPLQAIAGELYLAKDELGSMPDGESKRQMQERLTSIEENLFYIDKIVADLQDYTKPLQPNKEKVNIEKTIEEALLIVAIPDNLQVFISIEEGFPQITADFSMLKRILINLIQNAVQAMPKGGALKISALCKDNQACISIQDTGEGIPEEAKNKLFTPLFTTKSKGQGFGLAVVKRLIEAQGGKISFESENGKGTTFTIQLPLT